MSIEPASETAATKDPPDKTIGVDFVDILFALVVGLALMVLNRALKMPASGLAHLIFAVLLTVASWIGYHRSNFRNTGIISFNITSSGDLTPLVKFSLDIILVVLYWVAVQTTEWGFSSKHQSSSWRWTTAIAVAVFGIYVLWDWIAWLSTKKDDGKRWREDQRPVTVVFFILTLIVLGVAAWWSPRGNYGITIIDSMLILITILYRVVKDSLSNVS